MSDLTIWSARNASVVAHGDWALLSDQTVRGIIVTDHFGPQWSSPRVPPRIGDSGKILVCSREARAGGFQEALDRGAFFTIKELGIQKEQYPQIA